MKDEKSSRKFSLLIAEDDDDDYFLELEALKQIGFTHPVYRATDGEALMDYLLHKGQYQKPEESPRPGIILLDLMMPRKNGLEALKEIKTHEELRRIPIVVLTTSKYDDDVIKSYDRGANSFLRKPINFDELVKVLEMFKKYWLEASEIPDVP